MKVFYDTEFLERGYRYPINLISIGMVREDGQELYLINGEASLYPIYEHQWLRENVVPYLPISSETPFLMWNEEHPDYEKYVFNRTIIRERVAQFVLEGNSKPELWAWYGSYDHVVLAQLFDTMVELPPKFPKFTHDLRQLVANSRFRLPKQTSTEHHALEDARWVRDSYNWFMHENSIDRSHLEAPL